MTLVHQERVKEGLAFASAARTRAAVAAVASALLIGCLLLILPALAEAKIYSTNLQRGSPTQNKYHPLETVRGGGGRRGGKDRDLAVSSRIVGGSPVKPGAHPYFVEWTDPRCGGAVIWNDIVITGTSLT